MQKNVKIKGECYKIKLLDGLEHLEKNAEGICDKEKKIIYIDGSRNNEQREKTFLHEVCHAILHECGVDQALNDEIEEVICESISTGMHKIFFK